MSIEDVARAVHYDDEAGALVLDPEGYARLKIGDQREASNMIEKALKEKLLQAKSVSVNNLLDSVTRKAKAVAHVDAVFKMLDTYKPQLEKYIENEAETEVEWSLDDDSEKGGRKTKTVEGVLRNKDTRLKKYAEIVKMAEEVAHHIGCSPDMPGANKNILNINIENYSAELGSAADDFEAFRKAKQA